MIGGNDLTYAAMGAKIGEFEDAARDADVTLLFYAGHGMQVNGRNFLVPINAKLERESHFSLKPLMQKPFCAPCQARAKRRLPCSMPAATTHCRAVLPARWGQHAQAPCRKALPCRRLLAAACLIGFATAPGDVAADGEGRNSPFTTALLKHLPEPGVEIQQVMTRVKRDVF